MLSYAKFSLIWVNSVVCSLSHPCVKSNTASKALHELMITITLWVFFLFFNSGDTQYSKAFRSAFNLLKGSSSGRETSRTKVIIFLTDGKPTDEPTEIMQTIQTENAELDNKVVIMTYGMEQDLQILRDIANQDGGRYGVSQTSDVTVSTTTVFTALSIAQDEEKSRLPIKIRTLNLPIW